MRLALIHRTPGAGPPPVDSTAWRTCLRELHFLPGHRIPFEPAAITDDEAYTLLLEVVCGLRSPLLGETEVQAQFKAFLASAGVRDHRWLRTLGQRVLGDAKRIRHKHLQGFGAHSYGHLVARYLTGNRVAVIGTGALAAQVVRVAPPGATLDVWGRSSERVLPTRPDGLNFSLLADAATQAPRKDLTTVVVAAPVWSEDLTVVMQCYERVHTAVDLRSPDQQTPIVGPKHVVGLEDVLSGAARDLPGDDGAPSVRAAQAEIRELAAAFAQSDKFRPFGWDDLCA